MPLTNKRPTYQPVRPVPSHVTDRSRITARQGNPDWFNNYVQPQLETLQQQPVARIGKLLNDYLGDPTDPGNMNMAGIAISPKKMWYHGSSKPHKKFNPRYNDASDLLGSMTHAAADPNYANEFARTDEWNKKLISDPHWEGLISDPYWEDLGVKGPQSHIIPANANVKNAIDVTSNDPNAINWKDLTELHRSNIDLSYSKDRDLFPGGIRGVKSRIPKNLEFMAERMLRHGGKDWAASTHGASKSPNKIPRNYLESLINDQPLALKNAGFDGVLYQDNIATVKGLDPTVLAVQNPSQLVSPYTGKPLGLNIKPENLDRIVQRGGGTHLIDPKINRPTAQVKSLEESYQLLNDWMLNARTKNWENVDPKEYAEKYLMSEQLKKSIAVMRTQRPFDKASRLTDRFNQRGQASGVRDFMHNPEADLKENQLLNQIWDQYFKYFNK